MSQGATKDRESDSGRVLRSTLRAPGSTRARSSRRAPVFTHRIDDWELLGELGRGAMGVVYRARHVRLPGREVALKLIAATVDDENGRQRFQREGEALARLDHPNIVGVHVAGVVPDGRPYLVMELIRGKDLQELADEVGTLGAVEAARLLEPVARAVAHMHERGVMHRDLKLANVELGDDGRVCVMDFGLANLTDRRTRLTVSQEILGTPLAMAPEVIRDGNSPAPQEDVYAIGVMLYRLTIGRYPYYATTLDRLFDLIERAPLEIPADLDPELTRVIRCCLAKDPRDRYARADALADDLHALTQGERVSKATSSRWTDEVARAIERRRGPLFGTLAVLAIGLLTAIGLRLHFEHTELTPEPEAVANPAHAKQRAEAIAQVEALRGVPDVAILDRLRALLETAPAPPQPPSADDQRFLLTRAALALLSGDRDAARTLLRSGRPRGTTGDSLALAVHLTRLLDPNASGLGRLLAAAPTPDRLLAELDRVRARGPARSCQDHLVEGLLYMRLGWPATAALAFERALAALGPWPAWLEPVSFRIGPHGKRRVLPIGLAAQCGLASARSLLLDAAAARDAQVRPAALLEALGEAEALAELRALETGPLPASAPRFLPQAEAELAAYRAWPRWQRTRQLSVRSRNAAVRKRVDDDIAQELVELRVRLDKAERALALAVRQKASPVRIAVASGWIALRRGDRDAARAQLRRAEQHDPRAWQVAALAAAIAFKARRPAHGAAQALKAVKLLGDAGLQPIPLAAKRYEVLLEAYEALAESKRAKAQEVLAVLGSLAKLTRDAIFSPEVQVQWFARLAEVAGALEATALAAGARTDLDASRAARSAYDQLHRQAQGKLNLPNAQAEEVAELRRRAPLSSTPYLLRLHPDGSSKRLDAVTQAFLIEPMPTLTSLWPGYTPEAWKRARGGSIPRGSDGLRRAPDPRLPSPPDPDLRRAVFLLHDLALRVPTRAADRARGLAAIATFQARLPWSRAGALLSGLLRIELGDPAGAIAELLRTEQLGPLVADKNRMAIVWLHYHLARAHAAAGETDAAVQRLKRGIARGPFLTAAFLIDAEPRFRADPRDATTLRSAFRALKLLQAQMSDRFRGR